ncbi:biotin/lipoyl attachment domain-containing protein [Emticicia oligotrophica DSM 17448]|uniref:Biotin/lipoyl attachment domain-containing protein n=1 Tax=Emticicia oligotrophica (strain DSM 17448 / CIP 109782 / MTCC 6937 / GPTSA100-15) TaxID=929562 RepID=A0ABN4AI70_EMTOG|nr:acetyl-CoA carboxylase biotin carboxyl carrier protein subunit [Emticicia oligotrophica]AFK01711.1 biotin/lipoyl attachment domain-containing protein [Emticicia oligotrophica DSM 17448]
MLKAIVNDQNFEISEDKEQILLNNQPFSWDFRDISDNHYHIIKDNQSYNAELVEANFAEKIFKIKINGTIHTVNLKNRTDLLLEKMGMSGTASAKINNLKAPMPGLIFDMKVKEGDEVKKGDVLLILVAMKMENAIKATGDGKVKNIKVNTGDSVEKGQLIMEFE